MKVAVVGATGNVGTSVLHWLARDPAVTSIVGLARRRPTRRPLSDTDRDTGSDTDRDTGADTGDKVAWVAADIASDPLDDHLRGADVVVQLAWLIQPSHRRAELWRTNVVGTGRVLEAIARLKIPALVYSSSVGAYSRGPRDRPVDERWPTDGIPELDYSWQKAYVERMLDRFERDEPGCRVVRLRPGLVFKATAAPEIHRLFVGAAVPRRALGPWAAPLVARAPLRFQCVHSLDLGRAFHLAATGDARGAFNVAAEPVIGQDHRWSGAFARGARGLLAAAWRARLAAAAPSWVDLAAAVPIMDTTRAGRELGWRPERSAFDALHDLLAGFRGDGLPTPPLDASA